jgi:hypothetical protein
MIGFAKVGELQYAAAKIRGLAFSSYVTPLEDSCWLPLLSWSNLLPETNVAR